MQPPKPTVLSLQPLPIHNRTPAHVRPFLSTITRPGDRMPREEYAEPASYALSILYRTMKYIVIGVVTIGGGGYIAWRGGHFYLEKFVVSTPSELSTKARDCLRGAYISEHVFPDMDLVGVYLSEARNEALKSLSPDDPIVLDIIRRMGDAADRRGELSDALIYYIDVWNAAKNSETDLGLYVASRMANIYLRLASFADAEKCIQWSMDKMVNDNASPYQVTALTQLASIKALQKDYKQALNLYTVALKHTQQDRAVATPLSDPPSPCQESIIMSHIGEMLWGLNRRKEAMGWFQKAYVDARKVLGDQADVDMPALMDEVKKRQEGAIIRAKRPMYDKVPALRDCDECIGLSLSNMALALQKQKTPETLVQARDYLNTALGHALRAQDVTGEAAYKKHLQTTEELIERLNAPPARKGWFW